MSETTISRKLTLDDIQDVRAYERGREDFRAHVIALKKRRRLPLGPVVTVLFENRDTIRFQIQEMARAEKILTDEGIQHELDTYNVLVPEPGQVSATVFLELTNETELRQWLPRLLGIERSLVLRLADGTEVRCTPEEDHDAALTRKDITASVHYMRWDLDPAHVAALAAGPVTLVADHAEYQYEAALCEATRAELVTDAR